MIDEARILVGKTIVILAPDMRTQQVVERCNLAPPGESRGDLQPLGVLIEHRINDVNERLVAVEQPVSSGEQVAFEPTLALMLAQHLHDWAALRQELIVAAGFR